MKRLYVPPGSTLDVWLNVLQKGPSCEKRCSDCLQDFSDVPAPNEGADFFQAYLVYPAVVGGQVGNALLRRPECVLPEGEDIDRAPP